MALIPKEGKGIDNKDSKGKGKGTPIAKAQPAKPGDIPPLPEHLKNRCVAHASKKHGGKGCQVTGCKRIHDELTSANYKLLKNYVDQIVAKAAGQI